MISAGMKTRRNELRAFAWHARKRESALRHTAHRFVCFRTMAAWRVTNSHLACEASYVQSKHFCTVHKRTHVSRPGTTKYAHMHTCFGLFRRQHKLARACVRSHPLIAQGLHGEMKLKEKHLAQSFIAVMVECGQG